MLDIGGFLTSAEFLTQLATLLATVFSALFGTLVTQIFGAPAA